MNRLHEHPQVAVLFDPTCRAIFEEIARSPASARQLAARLEVAPIEVQRATRQLAATGLICAMRERGAVRYQVDRHGLASMRQALESAWVRRWGLLLMAGTVPSPG